MKITIEEQEGVTNIQLNGRLDGNSSEQTAEKVLGTVDEGARLVIDMTECGYVSSAGLRALLMIGKKVKLKSGTLKFVNLCEEVTEVMEITGFAGIFKGFEE